MAASLHWPQDAELLNGIEDIDCGEFGRIQVGLHLVLASEKPLGRMSCVGEDGKLPGPDRLLAKILTRQIDPDEFYAEIERQFAAFKVARGLEPDFVDAHQHVHVYPILRKLVASATKRHAPNAWVRVPNDRLSAILTRPFAGIAIGSAVHSLGFRSALAKTGLRSNVSFAGHYDFGDEYQEYLPSFFNNVSLFHLIMCHPGTADLKEDPIARARVSEAEIIGRMTLEERVASLRAEGRHV